MVFRYHSKLDLNYHFWGKSSGFDFTPAGKGPTNLIADREESEFWRAGSRRNHDFMAAEEMRVKRECARPQQGDCGGHHYQFQRRQLSFQQRPSHCREHGERVRKRDDGRQDAHHRSEKSNQKARATSGQQQADEELKRPRATTGKTRNALDYWHSSNSQSHQQKRRAWTPARKRSE
jgi:hypothetical protein